ncbi:hypothetical protein CASFOL_008172 [Castilleja foliolosa]|uniref:Uncharacterized protein n=1 Tax=Castilleja foliolosa TaxID=1961234 RepID=A0ABD3DZ90_9LAMI
MDACCATLKPRTHLATGFCNGENGFLGEKIRGFPNNCDWGYNRLGKSLSLEKNVKKIKPGIAYSVLTGESNNGTRVSDTTNVAGSLIGLKRKNCDDIYRLYCEHARQVGFSVRKTTTRWNEESVGERCAGILKFQEVV